jgi:hypothetical protein
MFGETESESPRMPSPWEAISQTSPQSLSPSPLSGTSKLSGTYSSDATTKEASGAKVEDSISGGGRRQVEMPLLDADEVCASPSSSH